MGRTTTATRVVCAAAVVLLVAGCATSPELGEAAFRRDVFGIGVFWSDWLSTEDLPAEYQSNPRAYDQAQLDMIVEAGGTATHGSFDWSGIEPVPGTYEWTRADERVEDALARGLRIYAYLGNTPDWATPPGDVPGYRTPPAEQHAGAFEAYVEAVTRRYKGKVEHFFFWNEPNGCSWINDGCSNSDSYTLYTKWLKRAYTALKRGNPDAVLAAGALDYGSHVPNGYEYLEGMYEAGAKGYFDAFDIHAYDPDGLHWDAIHQTRRVLDEHEDTHVEIWVSEYGWTDSETTEAATRLVDVLDRLTEDRYATVTYARYLVMSDLPGATYGLSNRELTPYPIYAAYQSYQKDQFEFYYPPEEK